MSDTTTTPPACEGRSREGALTEDEARALLDEQARSGLSFTDFARAHHLSRQRLSWWKAKFAGKRVDRSAHAVRPKRATPATPRFVPVVVGDGAALTRRTAPTAAAVPAPRGAYELALGSALTLRIPHDFQDDALARLVRVLQEAR